MPRESAANARAQHATLMTLATRCPNCSTTFRVVSDQLKLRKGLVKCGRCTHVFNGVEHLRYFSSDEASISTILAPATLQTSGSAPPALAATERGEAAPSPASTPDPVLQREAIARITESIERDLPPPEPAAPSRARTASRRAAPIDPLSPLTLLDLAPDDAPMTPVDDADLPLPHFLSERERPRWQRWAFASLSVVAAVTLIAQAAVVWRAEAATRWPALRAPLSTLCDALPSSARCTVELPRHITQVRISAAELQAARVTGQYVLLVTLHNDSTLPQAWPTLDVIVSDVDNRPIARRSIDADDYLRDVAAASDALGAGLSPASDASIRVPLRIDAPVVGYTVGIYYR